MLVTPPSEGVLLNSLPFGIGSRWIVGQSAVRLKRHSARSKWCLPRRNDYLYWGTAVVRETRRSTKLVFVMTDVWNIYKYGTIVLYLDVTGLPARDRLIGSPTWQLPVVKRNQKTTTRASPFKFIICLKSKPYFPNALKGRENTSKACKNIGNQSKARGLWLYKHN